MTHYRPKADRLYSVTKMGYDSCVTKAQPVGRRIPKVLGSLRIDGPAKALARYPERSKCDQVNFAVFFMGTYVWTPGRRAERDRLLGNESAILVTDPGWTRRPGFQRADLAAHQTNAFCAPERSPGI